MLVRAYADRIVVLFDEEVVANHPRSFKREQVVYDPWHYLPVLMRKPGALRNGAPFKDWDLPRRIGADPRQAAASSRWRSPVRQNARLRAAGRLSAVEAACIEALAAGIANGDVVMAILARRRQPPPPPSITTPDALKLAIEPIADCARYDTLRPATRRMHDGTPPDH